MISASKTEDYIPTHLLEVIPKLNYRCSPKESVAAHLQLTVLERVYVALDEQQVRAALHRQESRARDVDPVRVLEVLNRGAGGGLELHNLRTVVVDLGVDDDFELHALGLHDALERAEVDPEVVGVEDLEFADWIEN